MKSEAIIFDLDDTLYSYQQYKFSGFQAVATYAAEHTSDSRKEVYNHLVEITVRNGISYGDAFEDLIRERRWESIDLSTLVDVYRTHEPDISLPARSQRVLNSFAECGHRLAILTEGDEHMQQSKLDAMDLKSYVDGYRITPDKTETEVFESLLSELSVEASDAVYIGDNPRKDFVVPADLGMTSVRIRKGIHAHEPNWYVEPEFEVDNIEAVVSIVT